ncbi:MAG: diguanylate cyclase [Acidobacteria bacterium]|nr:diguanylate cyclase [Acidobacteriota bacterium]MCG3192765.1 Sensor histidine kinase RcsC [Thermoanaerobaculia bacterium]MCK6684665.1 diguanylate cyclase [Thermoanaerobaculia bacterium]
MSDGGTRKRVLIVDDEPANVHALASALRDQCLLSFATSGAKALELASAGGVDLVLLDVVMPGMDGFEVCRRLKAEPSTRAIPVIFVTALGDAEDETRGFDVGGVDYIAKPIRPGIVRARVRTHLELKTARDLLEQLALLDALTGIANRRRFDEALEHEWQRAHRARTWLTLGILDVDHFKKFNDHYGHAEGDRCLRAVAQAAAAALRRPADLIARFGGEEFAFILPDSGPAGSGAVVRDLLDRIRALGLAHAASPTVERVTVSAGVISLMPEAVPLGASSAMVSADRLLYEAKQNGRARAILLDFSTGARSELLEAPSDGLVA